MQHILALVLLVGGIEPIAMVAIPVPFCLVDFAILIDAPHVFRSIVDLKCADHASTNAFHEQPLGLFQGHWTVVIAQ
ncbi:hypothetical protein CKO31_12005 [Thiohalocapsa halophila]|uniref:Secreted protein n=1 Tax=Thiohalocapsa halophila TaxID=69359 RepID=A0ABS1CJB1_9GAMM|nr:hypothetical protein [Thiohalocapsa halophila]